MSIVPDAMSPAACVCDVGVRESLSRESFPMHTVLPLVPVGMRAMSIVPDVIALAACVCDDAAASVIP